MARTVSATRVVPLAPEAALALWADTDRWPSFVEGFARVLERSGEWPHEGAKVVWESTPEGRGRVTEKVVERGPAAFVSQVFDKSINGRQALRVREDAEGSRVELALEYALTNSGPVGAVTDLFFIRRALRDSLARTLRRFAVEAEEEAGLR
jgi:polyketide cyclase/dehydrase/lipid transport protein